MILLLLHCSLFVQSNTKACRFAISLGLHFLMSLSCHRRHVESVCFCPIDLSYVNSILTPSQDPMRVEVKLCLLYTGDNLKVISQLGHVSYGGRALQFLGNGDRSSALHSCSDHGRLCLSDSCFCISRFCIPGEPPPPHHPLSDGSHGISLIHGTWCQQWR